MSLFVRKSVGSVYRLNNLLIGNSKRYLSDIGSGAGKGGGTGGSIRDAGGAFGKMEAAREEEYFRKKQRDQLEAMRKGLDKEKDRLEKLIKEHELEIKKLQELQKEDKK